MELDAATYTDNGPIPDIYFTGNGKLSLWSVGDELYINGDIYTLVDSLSAMVELINGDPGRNFALIKDCDAAPDGVYASSPISATFTGQFQGLGHTISNLTIKDTATNHHVGLFGTVHQGGVANLSLVNVNVTGAGGTQGGSEWVGAFMGFGGYATGLHASGHVTAGGYSYVGGIAGFGGGSRSSFDGSVKGGNFSYVGGIGGNGGGALILRRERSPAASILTPEVLSEAVPLHSLIPPLM